MKVKVQRQLETPRITNVQILLFNAVLTVNYSFQIAEHPTRWQIMFE